MPFPSCLHPSIKGYLILPETSWWCLTFCGLIFSQSVFAIPSNLISLLVPRMLIYFERASSAVSNSAPRVNNNWVQFRSGSANWPPPPPFECLWEHLSLGSLCPKAPPWGKAREFSSTLGTGSPLFGSNTADSPYHCTSCFSGSLCFFSQTFSFSVG